MNELETLTSIIKNRRAVFPVQYTGDKIPDSFIRELLELANWAPTHKRTEPWRYIVISGAAKSRLGDFMADKYREYKSGDGFSEMKYKKTKKKCDQSEYIILICIKRDQLERIPEWEEIASVAMSVQNMWLACSAAGVGCYWSTPSTISDMSEFTDLGEGVRCLGLFYIGVAPEELPGGIRGAVGDKVTFLNA